jgi:hypothetical protein
MWLIFFLLQSLWATPKSFEVWFISNQKAKQVLKLLEERSKTLVVAQADLSCVPMGEFCFDPQVGMYKKESNQFNFDVDPSVPDEDLPQIPSARSIDRNLLVCESGAYFDIFCGQAQKVAERKISFDLWIDTSSSMREMDPPRDGVGCYREQMMKKLHETCPFGEKVHVMQFDIQLRPGSMGSLCVNQGLNDVKKMIQWIEENSSERLVIITDLYEYHEELAQFAQKNKGSFRGEKGDLSASDLLSMADQLAKSCL